MPQFSTTTMRMYSRYPEIYRAADAQINPDDPNNNYPLLRFISLIGDQAGYVEGLLDRFNYIPTWAGGPTTGPGSTSDLVNPATADVAWLPWLAQLVGITLPAGASPTTQRSLISGASANWARGSRASMIAAAQSQLTGGQFVRIVDHVGGDMWRMEVITRASETPQPSTVISEIIATGNKPAGVILTQLYYEASWATIENVLPTWADWETAPTINPLYSPGSWEAIEETQATMTNSWATIEADYTSWTAWEAETWEQLEGLSTSSEWDTATWNTSNWQ